MMKALVYHGPGKGALEDKPKPTVKEPTDAVARITRTTICGTDLHIMKGDVSTVTDGRTLGHICQSIVAAEASHPVNSSRAQRDYEGVRHFRKCRERKSSQGDSHELAKDVRNTMRRYGKFVIGGVLCCSFALMAGCASSELVDIWSDSSFQTPSLNKMLVISVGKNSVQRRIWEDAFSVELGRHDVTATPSYRLFPDAVPDTNQVIQIVRSNGFDGVLVTRWLPSETKIQYLQGYVTKEQDMRYDRRRDRFVTYYREIEHAGYVDSQKVDIRAFDVWATKNEGQMIWSATSKTPEPNSVQEVRPEIVKLVMSELTQQGIIASER